MPSTTSPSASRHRVAANGADKPAGVGSADQAGISDARLDGFRRSVLDNLRHQAIDGQKHDALLRTAITLGGIQADGGFSDAEAWGWMRGCLPDSVEDWAAAERTAVWGLAQGRARPLKLEDREQSFREGTSTAMPATARRHHRSRERTERRRQPPEVGARTPTQRCQPPSRHARGGSAAPISRRPTRQPTSPTSGTHGRTRRLQHGRTPSSHARPKTPWPWSACATVSTSARWRCPSSPPAPPPRQRMRGSLPTTDRETGWSVPPIFWLMLIADSGLRKTILDQLAFAPLRHVQSDLWRPYSQALRNWKLAPPKGRGPKPTEPHSYIVDDITPEKLGDILAATTRGTAMFKDELVGLFEFDRYRKGGGEAARGFFLSAYEDAPRTVHRVGRDSQNIEHTGLSIFGGIQPARLADFKDLASDGLLQRFAPLRTPPAVAARPEIDIGAGLDDLHQQSPRCAGWTAGTTSPPPKAPR